jgi:hypothetical protein
MVGYGVAGRFQFWLRSFHACAALDFLGDAMTDDAAYPWSNEGRWSEFYAAVGYLCQQWNVLELLYVHRASDIMGLKRAKHDLIFRHLGIVAIGEFMNDYAASHIKSKATRDQLAYVTNYVNGCRVNRNVIVHGWARSDSDQAAMKMTSKADQRRRKQSDFFVTLADINRVCDEIEMAGRLTVALSFLIGRGGVKTAKNLLGADWRPRLHAKPLLPKFVGAKPQTPPKPKPRHPSSRRRLSRTP